MEDKMKILEMLDAGKITPEQASELIKAIGAEITPTPEIRGGSQVPPQGNAGPSEAHTAQSGQRMHGSYGGDISHQNNNGPRNSQSGDARGFDEIASDLRDKLGGLAKEWEPRLKVIAGAVAEKTVDFADKVTKEVTKAVDSRPSERSSSSAGSQGGSTQSGMRTEPARSSTRPGQTFERSFELIVAGTSSEFVLAGLNAPVTIKGYNGDKISAKITCKPKQLGADIALVSYGNKYILNYDAAAFLEVSVDAYVPEKLFSIINVSTTNALLHVSNIGTVSFNGASSEGSAIYANIDADRLDISASSGKLELSGVSGKVGRIDAVNSVISAVNLDIEDMKLESSNAPINLSITDYTNFNNYVWNIETSNGRIFANIPSTPALGYSIKAASALGSVKLGLTGMEYSLNSASNVEARSANYDTCTKRVNISFETSNDGIIIN